MGRTAQRFLSALVILSLIFSAAVMTGAVPPHSEELYATDYAEVLSEETKNYIINTSKSLYEEKGAQIAVLTIKSLDGVPREEYALDTHIEWGLGTKDVNNGVLILLATEDREVFVSVGDGLEGCLPDGKTGRLIDDNTIPYYKNDNFDKGTVELYTAVVNVVREEYGLEPVEGLIVAEQPSDEESVGVWGLVGAVLLMAVFTVSLYLGCWLIVAFFFTLKLMFVSLGELIFRRGKLKDFIVNKYFPAIKPWYLIECLILSKGGDGSSSSGGWSSGSSGGGGSSSGGGSGRSF